MRNFKSEYEHYLSYSINLCNRYVYTYNKLKRKLISKNLDISTINKILLTLEKYNLINDKALIKELIKEMLNNYYGLNRIKERLYKMNFNIVDINNEIANINQKDITIKLGQYINKNKPKYMSNKKTISFINKCLRRGYDINDIKYYLI